MKRILLFTLAVPFFCCMSCSESEEYMQNETANEIRVNGDCDVHSFVNTESATWSIVESPSWITPVKAYGDATDSIKLYVESNSLAERNGVVIVKYSNGKTRSTRVSQSAEQTEKS